jgi:hypothetical protein
MADIDPAADPLAFEEIVISDVQLETVYRTETPGSSASSGVNSATTPMRRT